MAAGFPHDIFSVGGHRMFTDPQFLTDLVVGQTFFDQVHNGEFSFCEAMDLVGINLFSEFLLVQAITLKIPKNMVRAVNKGDVRQSDQHTCCRPVAVRFCNIRL